MLFFHIGKIHVVFFKKLFYCFSNLPWYSIIFLYMVHSIQLGQYGHFLQKKLRAKGSWRKSFNACFIVSLINWHQFIYLCNWSYLFIYWIHWYWYIDSICKFILHFVHKQLLLPVTLLWFTWWLDVESKPHAISTKF